MIAIKKNALATLLGATIVLAATLVGAFQSDVILAQLPGAGATTVNGQTCTLGSTCTTTIASASDYAATTWTPTITASGTPGTPAYTLQFGSYERLGRLIQLRGTVILSGWTGTPAGNVTIGGLPFANNATSGDGGRCYFSFWTVASSGGHITGEISQSASVITVYSSSSTASTNLTAANTGTTPTLDFSCNYHL